MRSALILGTILLIVIILGYLFYPACNFQRLGSKNIVCTTEYPNSNCRFTECTFTGWEEIYKTAQTSDLDCAKLSSASEQNQCCETVHQGEPRVQCVGSWVIQNNQCKFTCTSEDVQ